MTEVSPEKVKGELVSSQEEEPSPVGLRLFQALPKGDKFEAVVRQGVELGVGELVPTISSRCVAVPPADRRDHKLQRWRAIARAAAEQSGRCRIPPVLPVMTWGEALAEASRADVCLIPWECEERRSLKDVLRPLDFSRKSKTIISVLIGPEGGFDPAEVAQAVAAGAVPVTLGAHILRTETVGLFVASAVLYEYSVGKKEGSA